MFFKNKIKSEGAVTMFDMTKIGANISKLRKAINLTQMELADKLNISFQAVSNWERGISMPDISKLTELSEILHVSIDEILENKRASLLVDEIIKNESLTKINNNEIAELAPILKTEQVDKIVKTASCFDINSIASVAPFLSQKFIDELAANLYNETGDLNSFAPIVPFVSSELIDNLAMELSKNGADIEKINGILPFISESVISEFAEKKFKDTGDLNSITGLMPFLNQNFIDSCAADIIKKADDLSSIACIAPFISSKNLNEIAIEALNKKGLNALSPIIPFIDSKIIEDYIKSNMFK
ncbi:MAG: immR 3 [Clostridia bacterium]|nr:immR 3 [Clostridia bacterium]